MVSSPFFDKTTHSEMFQKPLNERKLARHEIINLVREKGKIRFADLKRVSGWRQTTLWNFVRQLEFSMMFRCEIVLDRNNRAQKVIFWKNSKEKILSAKPTEVRNGS